jgi:uncharacterized OB-fold protein
MTDPLAGAELLAPELVPYLRGAAEGRPVLPRCASCGRFQFPPRPVCRYCPSEEFEWPGVVLRGSIYSWTVTERAPVPGFDGQLPLTLVVVALDLPDPVRLIGRLETSPNDPHFAAGAAVVGEFRSDPTAEAPVLCWRLARTEP